jgi:hypothetical protein
MHQRSFHIDSLANLMQDYYASVYGGRSRGATWKDFEDIGPEALEAAYQTVSQWVEFRAGNRESSAAKLVYDDAYDSAQMSTIYQLAEWDPRLAVWCVFQVADNNRLLVRTHPLVKHLLNLVHAWCESDPRSVQWNQDHPHGAHFRHLISQASRVNPSVDSENHAISAVGFLSTAAFVISNPTPGEDVGYFLQHALIRSARLRVEVQGWTYRKSIYNIMRIVRDACLIAPL